MERVIDENYYELAWLSWMIKIGEIFQPKINHADPALFGLTSEQAIKMRISHLRASKRLLEAEYQEIKREYLNGRRNYGFIGMNSLSEQIDKLSKAIYFNRQRLKGDTTNQPFDLTALKAIPLDRITKINASGFFQTNPFRTEKEPSNSLFYYRKDNRATDFATGKNYDSVDVYMAVNAVDFKTACKEMQSL